MRKYIIVTYLIQAEEGQYAVRCPELGTASCGDTIEEALDNIKDAVAVHVETLREIGALDAFLAERRINVLTRRPRHKEQSISLPENALGMTQVLIA